MISKDNFDSLIEMNEKRLETFKRLAELEDDPYEYYSMVGKIHLLRMIISEMKGMVQDG